MNYIFPAILLIDAVIAFYYAVHYHVDGRIRTIEGRMFAFIAAFSGIWSAGFGLLFLQTSETKAYWCRAFGMVGVFWYLIMAMIIVCYIANIQKKIRYALYLFASLGNVLYFFVMKPGQTIFKLNENGMTYHFQSGIINTIYTLYSCIVALAIMVVIVYMIGFAKLRKLRRFGIQFLIVEIILLVGMILDTIFPLVGLDAIPGSSITQFIALLVIHLALKTLRQSVVDETNMAGYIYNSLANPVLVYDADRELKLANDAARTFLRLAQSGSISTAYPINILFQVEEKDVFEFEGNDESIDATCLRNKIECHLAISKIMDSYQDLIGYILVITDMTEHIQSMNSLQEAKDEADAANRSKSLFLANMSHEIRTPMNAIFGFSELALQEALNPNVKDYVSEIKNSADTLLSLINQILDISKIESGKIELNYVDYDLENLIHDVYHIIAMQAKNKKLDFIVKVNSDIPALLHGDRTRISEILINVLGNAVKYTKEGSITLELETIRKNERETMLLFQVSDTGIGIKEADLPKIFDSFTRVDVVKNKTIEGTGLGLALVKGYTELMGGTVAVQSEYGVGSKFSVVIPQWVKDYTMVTVDANKIEQAETEKTMSEMHVKDVYALVVDDNPVNLKVIQKTLEHYGLVVDSVSNGFDAIESCMQNKYDIVFMDQMMPQMDGVEAMQTIRKKNAYYEKGGTGKIVVLTANAITGVKKELLSKGFDEYLSKPIMYKELENVFVKLFDKEKISMDVKSVDVANNKQLEESTKEIVQGELFDDIGEKNPENSLQSELPMMDVATGILHCGGEENDYLEILELLVKGCDEQTSRMLQYWKERDISNYVIFIHAIKGSLLNVGCDEMGERARKLEMAGREDNFPYIEEHLDIFIEDYKKLVKHVHLVLNRHGYEIPEKTSEFELEAFKSALKEKIQNYDFAGMAETIRRAEAHVKTESDKEMFKQIKEMSDNMDLNALEELLQNS